jgi:hypothetical protein
MFRYSNVYVRSYLRRRLSPKALTKWPFAVFTTTFCWRDCLGLDDAPRSAIRYLFPRGHFAAKVHITQRRVGVCKTWSEDRKGTSSGEGERGRGRRGGQRATFPAIKKHTMTVVEWSGGALRKTQFPRWYKNFAAGRRTAVGPCDNN